jgi:hypothetical protein
VPKRVLYVFNLINCLSILNFNSDTLKLVVPYAQLYVLKAILLIQLEAKNVKRYSKIRNSVAHGNILKPEEKQAILLINDDSEFR